MGQLYIKAYFDRLLLELEEIMGSSLDGLDRQAFAEKVMDNWEGEPLESAYNLEEQSDALYELLGEFKYKEAENICGEHADALQMAAKKFNARRQIIDAEMSKDDQDRVLYRQTESRCRAQMKDLMVELNTLGRKLWNLRFPDTPLSDDVDPYLFWEEGRGIYVFPQFKKPHQYDPNSDWSSRDPAHMGSELAHHRQLPRSPWCRS